MDTSEVIASIAVVIAGFSMLGAFLTWLTGNRSAGAAESAALSARDAVALARESNNIAKEALELQRVEAAEAAEARRQALGCQVTVLGFRETPLGMVRIRNEGPGIARRIKVDVVAHETWWIGFVTSMNPGETVELDDWFTVTPVSTKEIRELVPEIRALNPHARVTWTDQLGEQHVTQYTGIWEGVEYSTEWGLVITI